MDPHPPREWGSRPCRTQDAARGTLKMTSTLLIGCNLVSNPRENVTKCLSWQRDMEGPAALTGNFSSRAAVVPWWVAIDGGVG